MAQAIMISDREYVHEISSGKFNFKISLAHTGIWFIPRQFCVPFALGDRELQYFE